MVPRTLTVLAAIRPGEEETLRDALRPIGDDVKGARLDAEAVRPRIEFCSSRRIHFARFAILDDPDRGRNRKRLLYSANYDGDLDSHLAELAAITSDMDAIWGAMEGYTGGAAFAAFIRAHTQEPEAFYVAFRDESVERIHAAVVFRRSSQTLTDQRSSESLDAMPQGLCHLGQRARTRLRDTACAARRDGQPARLSRRHESLVRIQSSRQTGT